MSEKIWVTISGNGRTKGNWEYYAEADSRVKAIRDRFHAKKVDERAVLHALHKIAGQRRIDMDWAQAIEGKECPPGRDAPSWEREVFEAWMNEQPREYRRIYGSAEVIAAFITEEK
jgi:hypothetical protein